MTGDLKGRTKFNTESIDIDIQEMQRLQKAFSEAMHLYCACITKNLGTITSFSTVAAEESFVETNFPESLRKEIYDCFMDGAIENVIERYTAEEYFMYRGVAIRGEAERFLGVWLLFAVDEDKIPEDVFVPAEIMRTNAEGFDQATVLLDELTSAYFSEKVKNFSQSDKLAELAAVKQEMQAKLELNETITEILKMMESEGSFSELADDVLRLSGKYIRCTNAIMLRLNNDDTTVDCVSEWTSDESLALKASMQNMDRTTLPFLTGRPYTISSDTHMPPDFTDFFARYGIRAAIFSPLNVNERPAMCLCYIIQGRAHSWNVETIKFINDVKRVLHSIMLRRITQNSLAVSYDTLKHILENSGCGVSVNDLEHRESLYVNETFCRMFSNEVDQLAVEDVLYDKKSDKTSIAGYPAAVSGKWFDILICNMKWVDGRDVRLSSFYDITEIKNYQKRIEFQSNIDYLTGLFNRRRLELDVDLNIRMSIRSKQEMALILLDIDDFNSINEGLGHRFGDEVLRTVARGIDTIKEIHGHCYRADGDEFVIIVTNDNIDKLDDVTGKIQQLFSKPLKIEEKELYCSMCLGVAIGPEPGADFGTIMQKAEMALHSAKSQGSGSVAYYNPEDQNTATMRVEMEQYMRRAIENGCKEFEVYYQPMIDISSGEAICYGAEALVRWNSEELGMVTPTQFIPLAEYLGLIVPIGEHVLREACRRCRYWNDFGHPEYGVHVNLSVVQLMQKDIVEVIQDAIDKSGVDAKNLTLEVTESLAVNDLDRTRKILEEIKKIGCKVALDDFGTGYSSLSHIRNLPIDTLKIDQSFTKNLCVDNFAPSFVKTISDLAKVLGMKVCIEGVEDLCQRDVVTDMNCVEFIQGFYYDKPLPADQFELKYLR